MGSGNELTKEITGGFNQKGAHQEGKSSKEACLPLGLVRG